MALPQLSDDVIAPILDYLDGPDIVHLSRTADMGFHAKVGRNARIWRIELPPFARFPFSVYDAPNLASFEAYQATDDLWYALDFGNRTLSPLVTQNRLVSLSFSFINCLSILDDSKLLSSAPNLRSLSCIDAYSVLAERHLNHLPLGLTKLILVISNRKFPLANLTFIPVDQFARLLPRPLEFVRIPSLALQAPTSSDHSAQVWPQNLKYIHVSEMPLPFMFDHAPPLIEYLRGDETGSAKMSMDRVPKSLTKVRMPHGFNEDPPSLVVLDSAMPSLMRTFLLGLVPPPSEHLLEAFLPPTLRYMHSLREDFPNVNFRTLLPNMNSAWLDSRTVEIEMFPLNAKSAEARSDLPHTFLPQLPRTLTTLTCCLAPGWLFEHLPRTLTKLQVRPTDGRPVVPPIPREQWGLLPPNLTDLYMQLTMLESASCLAELPQTLKELQFFATPLSFFTRLELDDDEKIIIDNYNEKVLKDKRLIQYLPTELETLGWGLGGTDCEWVAWTSDLAKYLPNLTCLTAARRSKPEYTLYPSAEECLGNLPPRLRSLTIQIDPCMSLPVDIFSKLPTRLRKLTLILKKNVGDDTNSLLRDDHFLHLPRHLTYLSFEVPRYLSEADAKFAIVFGPNITAEVIPKLPPFLIGFPLNAAKVRGDDWKEAWEHYNRPEKWLGFPPKTWVSTEKLISYDT